MQISTGNECEHTRPLNPASRARMLVSATHDRGKSSEAHRLANATPAGLPRLIRLYEVSETGLPQPRAFNQGSARRELGPRVVDQNTWRRSMHCPRAAQAQARNACGRLRRLGSGAWRRVAGRLGFISTSGLAPSVLHDTVVRRGHRQESVDEKRRLREPMTWLGMPNWLAVRGFAHGRPL